MSNSQISFQHSKPNTKKSSQKNPNQPQEKQKENIIVAHPNQANYEILCTEQIIGCLNQFNIIKCQNMNTPIQFSEIQKKMCNHFQREWPEKLDQDFDCRIIIKEETFALQEIDLIVVVESSKQKNSKLILRMPDFPIEIEVNCFPCILICEFTVAPSLTRYKFFTLEKFCYLVKHYPDFFTDLVHPIDKYTLIPILVTNSEYHYSINQFLLGKTQFQNMLCDQNKKGGYIADKANLEKLTFRMKAGAKGEELFEKYLNQIKDFGIICFYVQEEVHRIQSHLTKSIAIEMESKIGNRLEKLENRFEALVEDNNAKFEALEQKFEEKFASLEQANKALDQKFEQKFASLEQGFTEIKGMLYQLMEQKK